MLEASQVARFARQMLLPEIGRSGQERLLDATLTARGAGAALETAVRYLEAAGVRVVRGQERDGTWLGGHALSDAAFADERIACAACRAGFLESSAAAVVPSERAAVAAAAGAALSAELILAILNPARPPLAMAFDGEPRRASVVLSGCAC